MQKKIGLVITYVEHYIISGIVGQTEEIDGNYMMVQNEKCLQYCNILVKNQLELLKTYQTSSIDVN